MTDLVLRLLAELGEDLQAVALRWSNRAGEGYPVAAREALSAIVEFFVAHGPLVRAISEAAAGDERIELEYRRGLDGLVGLTRWRSSGSSLSAGCGCLTPERWPWRST